MIAEDIVILGNHITDVDSYSEQETLLMRQCLRETKECSLKLERTANRFHNTCKLRREPVARALDESSSMSLDGRHDMSRHCASKGRVGRFLIGVHEPGIAIHICNQDSGKSTSHSLSRPKPRS